jgi:hypothetical protein
VLPSPSRVSGGGRGVAVGHGSCRPGAGRRSPRGAHHRCRSLHPAGTLRAPAPFGAGVDRRSGPGPPPRPLSEVLASSAGSIVEPATPQPIGAPPKPGRRFGVAEVVAVGRTPDRGRRSAVGLNRAHSGATAAGAGSAGHNRAAGETPDAENIAAIAASLFDPARPRLTTQRHGWTLTPLAAAERSGRNNGSTGASRGRMAQESWPAGAAAMARRLARGSRDVLALLHHARLIALAAVEPRAAPRHRRVGRRHPARRPRPDRGRQPRRVGRILEADAAVTGGDRLSRSIRAL